jgi:preprotein translocase subunit SecA
MVSRRIEGAQKKVEERNFEVRKNLLEYDEVMDEQRKRVYGFRQRILDGVNCKVLLIEMIDKQIELFLSQFLDKHYGAATFASFASSQLGMELDPKDYYGLDYETAEREAKEAASQMAEGQVLDMVEENLPEDEDAGEWNWEALARMANTRWKLSLRDRDLKKVGREGVAELLIEQAREAVQEVDLSEGRKFLEPDFGVRTACGWVHFKFGLELAPDDVRNLEPPAFKNLVRQRAMEAYDAREAEYPVMAGFYHFTMRDGQGQKRYDREALVEWARRRFDVNLDLDDLRNKQREDVSGLLIEYSKKHQQKANETLEELHRRIDKLFGQQAARGVPARVIHGANGALGTLADWLRQQIDYQGSPEDLAEMDREQMELRLSNAVEDRSRPEIRRMERAMLLQLLDTAWKDHLLAMDHLRSSVGLRGYAQVDPKVEYKKEGMRTFELMWASVGERSTDLLFKMEQLDEGFVGSTWVESAAIHEEMPSQSEIAQQQQQAIGASQQSDRPIEPIRNRGERVGRNDPCPCGSGKKFKNCCMKGGSIAAL